MKSSLRRFRFLWVAGLLAFLPQQARACDPNCDLLLAGVVGVPSALATTLIAPLVGRAMDTRGNPPYWTAVGATAAASGIGVLVASAATNAGHGGGQADVIRMAVIPAALGSLATIVVYRFAARPAPGRSGTPRESRARVRMDPVISGRSAGVRLNF